MGAEARVIDFEAVADDEWRSVEESMQPPESTDYLLTNPREMINLTGWALMAGLIKIDASDFNWVSLNPSLSEADQAAVLKRLNGVSINGGLMGSHERYSLQWLVECLDTDLKELSRLGKVKVTDGGKLEVTTEPLRLVGEFRIRTAETTNPGTQ